MEAAPDAPTASLPAWRVEMLVLGQAAAQQAAADALIQATQRSIHDTAGTRCAFLRPVMQQQAPKPFMGQALVVGMDVQTPSGVLGWLSAHHMRCGSVLHQSHPQACVIFVQRLRLVAWEPGIQTIMRVRIHPPLSLKRGQGVEASLSAKTLIPYGLACDHGPVAWSPTSLSKLLQAAGPDVQAEAQACMAFLRQEHLNQALERERALPVSAVARL